MQATPFNLLIGTPAYGNLVHTDYTASVLQFKDAGITVGGVLMLGNESLITRARNTLLSIFHHQPAFTHEDTGQWPAVRTPRHDDDRRRRLTRPNPRRGRRN